MNINKFRISQLSALAFGLALMLTALPAALAQSASTTTTNSTSASTENRTRTISSGEKVKLKGVVTARSADTFTVRDLSGVDTIVRLMANTSVKEKKSNPFRGAKNYGAASILRGLYVEVEGRGDSGGQLLADKVRFSESELRVARTVEARVDPVENRVSSAESRVSQVEQNAQRLSGQIDELAAVSNSARGGARAAQATADAAVAGVNATNERISSLDDYTQQERIAVNFRPGSAVLSPDAKTQLDDIATKATAARGYVLEVSGYTDSTGSVDRNRALSQRRADAVIRYLVENHRIPLRRIVTPYGYGETQAIADNRSRDGRAQNRRVEIRMLVNRGLTQPVQPINNTTATTTSSMTTPN